MAIQPRAPIFLLNSRSKPPHECARLTGAASPSSWRRNSRTSARRASASGGSSPSSKRRSACSRVRLALAELDEEPVRILRMHPGHVVAPAVDAGAGLLQALDASRDVLALEAHEVDAFAVLGEEAADRLVRIGRLQELDVADPRRQDRVLESELLGLRSVMYFQSEEAGEALDRGVEIAHHDGQLDDVAQHGDSPPYDGRADHTVESAGSHAPLPRKNPVLRLGGHRRGIRDD